MIHDLCNWTIWTLLDRGHFWSVHGTSNVVHAYRWYLYHFFRSPVNCHSKISNSFDEIVEAQSINFGAALGTKFSTSKYIYEIKHHGAQQRYQL